jgi:SAM-dependent methyltransferase
MKIKLIKCPVCDVKEWEYLDELRDRDYWYQKDYIYKQPIGFKICKKCGFLTYDYEPDAELKRRYELERNIINVNHIITANRKLEYHKKFFADFFATTVEEAEKTDWMEINDANILDYGCGIGLLLNLLSTGNNCIGIELNGVQRKYIENEYGIQTFDSLDKVDNCQHLIICYHVLEHIQYPDELLKAFRRTLKDDGYIYISVPNNFNGILDEASVVESGDFENLYHLNHVNLFTELSLKNLLAKCGFEIVHENRKLYGYTVLCKKAPFAYAINFEDYKEIIKELKRQKEVITLFREEKYDKAIEKHETFVDAWCRHAIKDFRDLERQEQVLLEGLSKTNDHYKLKRQLGHLYFQWDENKANENNKITNHVLESKRIFEELISEKPGMEDFYYYLAMIEAKYFKNYGQARDLFGKIIEINPGKYVEIMNLIGWLWKEKE